MPRVGRDADDARCPRIDAHERSARLPDRRTLLGEGLRALFGVVGLEDLARELAILLERRAQALAQSVERRDTRRDRIGGGLRVGTVDRLERGAHRFARVPKLLDRV